VRSSDTEPDFLQHVVQVDPHTPAPTGDQIAEVPAAVVAEPQNPSSNTVDLHRVMFAVDDIDDTVARLRAHGAELLGEVVQYESIFRLCHLRGPAGIIVALAEQIS
jgi:hypothetical protein